MSSNMAKASVDVVVLAAGQGTRMNSALPKVLHQIGGKAMVAHVLDASDALGQIKKHVIIGHGAEKVKQQLTDESIQWAEQTEQLGTGHAVLQALPNLSEDTTLILYGDVPLIKTETLRQMLEQVNENTLSLLTVNLNDPTGYGRIVREQGDVCAIVEHKDASAEQLLIAEVNTGILAAPTALLQKVIPTLGNNNAQGEYYLTDVIAMAKQQGLHVATCQPENEWEVQGVNNRLQQSELERVWQQQQAQALMLAGVSVLDPNRIDIRGTVKTGKDVTIDVNVVFEGEVTLGDNVYIAPNSVIKNSTVGSNVEIHENSLLEEAIVADGCQIGPYARLRPQARLEKNARVGNFVEVKKSVIGEGSKVNHLTYIGDTEIGQGSNIGAGTITCNYDGVNKSKTIIGDNAFIGSNSSLVAPVTINNGATVGAGSTITNAVPENALAVARGKQRTLDGWKRPTKKK